jgi:hypothetical protein
MPGCSIESELVTAARKSRVKNIPPNNQGNGIFENTSGSTLNPRANVPWPIMPAVPRNTNAAGTVIMPPRATSQNSLALEAVNPLKTTSSFSLR